MYSDLNVEMNMDRRNFLGSAAATSALPARLRAAEQTPWDIIIVGAGTAGLPAAIFAARRNAKVLVIDAADKIGGTLHLAGGEISGAGTKLQSAKGLKDHPDIHYADVMRLSHRTADPDVTRLAVDHGGATLDWLLDGGLIPLPEHPVTGEGLDDHGYSVPRYLWGKNGGRDLLAVMAKQFDPLVTSGKVTLMLNARVSALLASDAGAVEGVRIGDTAIRGRHVILTTGGYAMNPDVFQRMVGQPAYAAGSYPQSQGDGLSLATSVGAALRGEKLHRPGTGSIMSADKFPATAYARFNTVVEKRPPWEIWVNAKGGRFIREDKANPYTLSRALFDQPRLKYAIVFDETILSEAPVGIPGWTIDKMREHFGTHPMFHRAETLAELAVKAGLDGPGLEKTVSEYNASVKTGGDTFGRAHMPRPIATAPYYAIIHLGHSATSSVGIVIDKDMRALRASGEPIAGLYAAGEVLGSCVTLGNAFCPGMMLTPAMTFGRLLGERLPLST